MTALWVPQAIHPNSDVAWQERCLHAAIDGLDDACCSIESVSRVLGHTNITTTQKYAKITTEKIDKDLTMFGNRLNQSFSEISIAM